MSKKSNKALITSAAFVITAILILGFLYMLGWSKLRVIEEKSLAAGQQVEFMEGFLKRGEVAASEIKFVDDNEISSVVKEITKVGDRLDVDFVSIEPEEAPETKDDFYRRLNIQMSLVAEYKDFGEFLGTLSILKTATIGIKEFQIQRDESLSPLVRSNVIAEVFLKTSTNYEEN